MIESSNPIFSPKAVSAIAANASFKFRVVTLPTGTFCVVVDAYPAEGYPCDSFPIEDYASEKEANALCKRLINQQVRDARVGRRSKRRGLSGLATPIL